MLLNQDVALSTPSILLVPYEPSHVPEYHSWMQRPELQELTASEPLTLEEEYAMQASWRTDGDKLTFIVCLPFASLPDGVRAGVDDSPDQMIGDINLFVSEKVDDGKEEGDEAMEEGVGQEQGRAEQQQGSSKTLSLVGEVEIMIAKPGATGQGRGRAALLAFLRYVHDHQAEICRNYAAGRGLRQVGLAPDRFDYLRVKIGAGNARSIGLFRSLGFAEDNKDGGEGAAPTPNVFGEVELRLQAGLSEALAAWDAKWKGTVSDVHEIPYERDITIEIQEGSEEEGDTEMAD